MKKILITSIGRTGTKSLKYFLDEISNVTCYHHKIGRRDVPFLFLSQIKDFSNVTRAYLEKRDKSTLKTISEFYIEVNPYLRFADHDMLNELGWKKIYLVRHPKTYLESVFIRELFTNKDYNLSQYPDNNDPFSEKWETKTRFEKLCWYYKTVHEYILDTQASFYRFEELTKNPDTLKELIKEIGIAPSSINTFELPKLNTSKGYKFRRIMAAVLKVKTPKIKPLNWESLSTKEKETYETQCVPLAKRLGYVL